MCSDVIHRSAVREVEPGLFEEEMIFTDESKMAALGETLKKYPNTDDWKLLWLPEGCVKEKFEYTGSAEVAPHLEAYVQTLNPPGSVVVGEVKVEEYEAFIGVLE